MEKKNVYCFFFFVFGRLRWKRNYFHINIIQNANFSKLHDETKEVTTSCLDFDGRLPLALKDLHNKPNLLTNYSASPVESSLGCSLLETSSPKYTSIQRLKLEMFREVFLVDII